MRTALLTAYPPQVPGTLLALLRELHGEWLVEVRHEVGAALAEEAGPGARFGAVRYLDTVFQLRLGRELEAVRTMAALLPPDRGAGLLAEGQLLELLRGELGDLSREAQGAQLLPLLLRTFLQALERWCADVEAVLGWMRRDTLSPQALERFLAVRDDLLAPALG